MRLDMPTLMLVMVAVNLTIGSSLLLSWSSHRSDRALAYWGWSYVARGLGVGLALWRDQMSEGLSISFGNAAILASLGLFWSGARAFHHRPGRIDVAFLGAGLWLVACTIPFFRDSQVARIAVSNAILLAYGGCAAFELFRGRSRGLPSRYPLIALILVSLIAYTAQLASALMGEPWTETNPYLAPELAVLAFTLIVIGWMRATLVLSLLRERSESELRELAETDFLTGIGNRRALIRESRNLLALDDKPVALLLFDLDHFKTVNDRYGHAVGDAVLVAFSSVLKTFLPPDAILGRLGGEEFGALIIESDPGDGFRLADLVRARISREVLEGFPALRITVSVGVSRTEKFGRSLNVLMAGADRALYSAKDRGRNLVVSAEPTRKRPAA